MCRSVLVRFTPEERAYAKWLSGLMVPVYAVVVLAIIAVAALRDAPRSRDMVAAAATPVAAPR
jgi:sugar phosphate permease